MSLDKIQTKTFAHCCSEEGGGSAFTKQNDILNVAYF